MNLFVETKDLFPYEKRLESSEEQNECTRAKIIYNYRQSSLAKASNCQRNFSLEVLHFSTRTIREIVRQMRKKRRHLN